MVFFLYNFYIFCLNRTWAICLTQTCTGYQKQWYKEVVVYKGWCKYELIDYYIPKVLDDFTASSTQSDFYRDIVISYLDMYSSFFFFFLRGWFLEWLQLFLLQFTAAYSSYPLLRPSNGHLLYSLLCSSTFTLIQQLGETLRLKKAHSEELQSRLCINAI